MSFRSRLHHIAFRGCLIAAVLLPGESYAQDNNTPVTQQPAQQQTAPDQSRPAPVSEPPGPVPAEQQKADAPAYDPRCDRPKDREDADLCEQRRMSKAAEEAAWWAAFQSKLGIAGFVAVVLSLIFTGWAAWASSGAALAAAKSANAAQKSADVSEEAFRRLERPYLFVQFDNMSTHHLKIKFVPHGVPYLTFKLANFGKMPAVLRSVSVGLLNNPTFPLISTFSIEKKFYEVIEPGAVTKDHRITVTDGAIGEPFLGAAATQLILYGLITYEDPTGAVHSDSFCMRGLPSASGFEIEDRPEYNWRKTNYPNAG